MKTFSECPKSLLLCLLIYSAIYQTKVEASSITRNVTIVGAQTLSISLKAAPSSGVSVYALEEGVSGNVTASNISNGGSFDAANGLIKWGPWFDAQARELTYELKFGDSSRTGNFPGGQGSFDGVNVAISGEASWNAGGNGADQGGSSVERSIAAVGGTLLVILGASPKATVSVYAIEEGVPSGMTPSNIAEGGSFDTANGLIKWGPWFDSQERALSYELIAAGSGVITFPGGQGSFDGVNTPTGGDLSVDLGGGSAANQAPIAQNASLSVISGQSLSFTLSASDPDGDSITYTIVTNPTHGALTGSGSSRTYTAATGYSGTDTFTFRVSDGNDDSNLATVTIEITGGNNGGSTESSQVIRTVSVVGSTLVLTLEAIPEPAVSVYAAEEGVPSGLVPSNISNGGSFDAANGLIKWGPWFDSETRALTYELATTGSGTVTFPGGQGSFDGINTSISGESTVKLGGDSNVNQAPIAQDSSLSVARGQSITLSLTASDPDGDVLSYNIVKWPNNGALSGSGSSWEYAPDDGFDGVDSFTFQASDGDLDSNLATVTIQAIEEPNTVDNEGSKVSRTFSSVGTTLVVLLETSPKANVSVYAVEEGVPSGLTPSNIGEGGSYDAANGLIKWGPWFDSDKRVLSYVLDIANQPSILLPGGQGSFDGTNITIEGESEYPTAPNNPPVAFAAVIKAESGKSMSALLYGYDPDEDDYQVVIKSEPQHGSLNLDGLPIVVYTSYKNFVGEDSFEFVLTDGKDSSVPAEVAITVTEPQAPKGIDSLTRLPSGKLVIEFTGTLKSSRSLSEPFLPVENAQSPLVTAASESRMFFIAD